MLIQSRDSKQINNQTISPTYRIKEIIKSRAAINRIIETNKENFNNLKSHFTYITDEFLLELAKEKGTRIKKIRNKRGNTTQDK